MNLNISCSMTPDQILLEGHKAIAIPSLIYAWIGFLLILLVVGLLIINGRRGNHPYRKFILIWSITATLSGFLILFLSMSPVHVQSVKNFILNTIP